MVYFYRIPEIGEELPTKNPFINQNGLPEFKNITVENCMAKIGRQSTECERIVKDIEGYIGELKKPPTLLEFIEKIINPIELAESELQATWALAKTLYFSNTEAMPVKSYVVMHQRAHRAELAKFNSLRIFNLMKEMRSKENLTPEQKRLIDKFILEAKLNGIALHPDKQEELGYNRIQLSQEKITFESKVNVAIDQFSHTITDYSEVKTFPIQLLRAMANDPKNHLNGPWKVTLQPYIYQSFLQHCPDATQRWNIWQANTRKASRATIAELDNSVHLEKIRDWRIRQAKLLGYKTYAEMLLETKMVNSIEQVKSFIQELLAHALPSQRNELKTLNEFAVQNGFGNRLLEEHDVPYWKRRYDVTVNNYDENQIQDYFPLAKVIDGMFALSEKLFNIKIIERNENVSRWHESVRLFDVYDENDKTLKTNSNRLIASFFLDAYEPNVDRTHPQSHQPNGWCTTIRSRISSLNSIPLIAIIYNFSSIMHGPSNTITLNEVQILFEKFGRALNELLTEANYRELSGTKGMEWDAVDITSKLFKNLLYRSDVLRSISEHKTTKQSLTDELIVSIQNQRNSFAGYFLSNQLYISSVDLELHTGEEFWRDIVRRLWPKYNVISLDKRDSRICSMIDIITGPYAGAYYSHLWSQMIAADINNAFSEKNTAEHLEEIGKRYRETFLASGGSLHASHVFRNFRGRDPSSMALIEQLQIYHGNKNDL